MQLQSAKPEIHVGEMVRKVFEAKPRCFTVVRLARMLNCDRSNVYDIFNRVSMDTSMLLRLSVALRHDFFAEISGEINRKKLLGRAPEEL